jgi:ATP-dependent DNA helicase PIF1
LNAEQQIAFDQMNSGKNVFITGSGGHGKSFLVNYFIQNSEHRDKIGLTSTTGVSALLIRGSTVHSYLGLGLGTGTISEMLGFITSRKFLKARWRKLKILIIDEISMMQPDLFDKLNELGKQIRLNQSPFGGIQIILTGDFLQLPACKSNEFCFETQSWRECDFYICLLTRNMRQTDEIFQACLEKVRMGVVDDEVKEILSSRMNLVPDTSSGIEPTALYPVNAMVDRINSTKFSNLIEKSGFSVNCYEMAVKIVDKSASTRVDTFRKSLPVGDIVELAKGAQVMLLYNLDIHNGLVNGSRGVVIGVQDESVVVRFKSGIYTIEAHDWEFEEDGKIILRFTQIPLKLAWSSSIHRAQGATLDCVTMNLSKCFEYGQAYVALSRVKSLDGLFIEDIDFSAIMAHPRAVKFYQELLE